MISDKATASIILRGRLAINRSIWGKRLVIQKRRNLKNEEEKITRYKRFWRLRLRTPPKSSRDLAERGAIEGRRREGGRGFEGRKKAVEKRRERGRGFEGIEDSRERGTVEGNEDSRERCGGKLNRAWD